MHIGFSTNTFLPDLSALTINSAWLLCLVKIKTVFVLESVHILSVLVLDSLKLNLLAKNVLSNPFLEVIVWREALVYDKWGIIILLE